MAPHTGAPSDQDGQCQHINILRFRTVHYSLLLESARVQGITWTADHAAWFFGAAEEEAFGQAPRAYPYQVGGRGVAVAVDREKS